MSEKDESSNLDYCVKCEAERKRTPLVYSEPPNKEVDTWTKRLAKKSDYRCLNHVRSDSKLHGTKEGRAKHKQRSESIEQYHQRRVMAFHAMWNDDRLIDDRGTVVKFLPDPERLMWIFIRYRIRKAILGFTPQEMTEVIREADIEFDISKKVAEWKEDAKARGLTLLVREQVEPELIKIYVSMKEEMQEAHRKRLVNSVRGIAHLANLIWEKRPRQDWEKIVTTPGHRDPAGNMAQRLHLLTEAETLQKRQERKMRTIQHIERAINHEAEVQSVAQEHEIKQTEEEQQK